MKQILHYLYGIWQAIDPVGKVAIIMSIIFFGIMLPTFGTSASGQMIEPNKNLPNAVWITEFDGCEYIVWQNNTSNGHGLAIIRGMTHKGNCKYCLRRTEELIKKWR